MHLSQINSESIDLWQDLEVVDPCAATDCDVKAANVLRRILLSPTFWAAMTFAATIGLAFAACLFPPFGVPVMVIVSVALTALLGIAILMYKNRNWFAYEISLFRATNYDLITDQLALGRIPLKNRMDHCALQTLGITAVLSVVEPYENHTAGLFSDPVTPDDWAALGIVHKQVSAKDDHPLTGDQIDEGVSFIREHLALDEKNRVYVHCKAGCSRSAAIVTAYLCVTNETSVDDTLNFLREKRSRVKLYSAKRTAPIELYLAAHHSH